MWSRVFAAALLATGILTVVPAEAARQEQLNNKYRENMLHESRELETALRRFERDLAAKRGGRAAASSKPKEIVVVGSKIKEVVRSPGFKGVSGLKAETDVVEFREGGPASLPKLQAAIRRFESAAGPRSPCVGKCRATARQCLSRCRASLRKKRMSGQCVCAHVQARCLVQAARGGKCFPPEPVRPRRR